MYFDPDKNVVDATDALVSFSVIGADIFGPDGSSYALSMVCANANTNTTDFMSLIHYTKTEGTKGNRKQTKNRKKPYRETGTQRAQHLRQKIKIKKSRRSGAKFEEHYLNVRSRRQREQEERGCHKKWRPFPKIKEAVNLPIERINFPRGQGWATPFSSRPTGPHPRLNGSTFTYSDLFSTGKYNSILSLPGRGYKIKIKFLVWYMTQ